ncbi:hypothetical protein ACLOJK_013643 [Asimina triloba]
MGACFPQDGICKKAPRQMNPAAKFVYAFIFMVVLIFSREIISSEGRSMKAEKGEQNTKNLTNGRVIGTAAMKSADNLTHSNVPTADVDDLGLNSHSPGIGNPIKH